MAGGVGDEVLPEDEVLAEPAAGGEHLQRLRAAYAGGLVGGGDHAPGAGLGDPEEDRADPDPAPPVLGPWLEAGYHRVGPEPVHRHRLVARLGEPLVELVERVGAGEQ